MVFSSLIPQPKSSNPIKKISRRQYELWRSGYLFDAIRGIRYGQSFCNHFGIKDNILFYDDRSENCHRYICKNYVANLK